MTTLRERAIMATHVRQNKAATRAEYVRANVGEGMTLRRAAWYAGVSYRTARRYREMVSG